MNEIPDIDETFECGHCEKTFVSAWSNEKAVMELEILFPKVPIGECVILCDTCWQRLLNGH